MSVSATGHPGLALASKHQAMFRPLTEGMPKADGSSGKALEEQAQKWVSATFFGTILKQMRESPFKSEIFSGGRGGQAWGQLYDQQMADRMSRGVGQKLVKSIVRKLEARSAYEKQVNAVQDARTENRQDASHVETTLRA